jgi:hypothetical protein
MKRFQTLLSVTLAALHGGCARPEPAAPPHQQGRAAAAAGRALLAAGPFLAGIDAQPGAIAATHHDAGVGAPCAQGGATRRNCARDPLQRI